MVTEFLFLDGIGNVFPFVVIGLCTYQPDLFPFYVFRPQVFRYLPLITFDYFVGGVDDALCAPVVLFQFYHLNVVIIFLELQNIFNRRTAETVDTLGIIPDHANIFVYGTQ